MRKIYFLLVIAMISSTLSFAQSEFQASSIEYGTFIGETLPFRDYETSTPVTDLDDPIVIRNNINI